MNCLDAFKVIKITRKYGKCPKCKDDTTFELKDEVATFKCKCGWMKKIK